MRPTSWKSVLFLAGCALAAQAQSWQPPPDNERCPSKWGPGDERGSGNLMTPKSVLRASSLIRTGTVYELGQVLSASGPFFGTRKFDLTTKRTVLNPGANRRGSNEEIVHGEMGQIGTQFDTFSHQTIGDSLYNCFKLEDVATRSGFTRLGVEKVGLLMTRAVLIDVAAQKQVPVLPPDYEIRPADLEAALRSQGVALEPGDAVLIHTGWGRYWGTDNARYGRSSPGIGVATAEWLARQNPMLVGADNPSIEISPNPDPKISLPVHQIMLVVNGIHLLENLRLDRMAADKVYQAAFILQPLKMQGATGSTVAPVAIR
jgi:kynurenine formamidase